MDCVLSSRISKSDRVTQDKGGIRFRLRLLFLNGLTRSTERSVGRFFSLSTFGLLRSQKGRRGALEKQKWDPTETEFFGLIKFPRVRYRTLLRDIKDPASSAHAHVSTRWSRNVKKAISRPEHA
ncbi:uncharacterized protein DFL_008814 [Arthrobotrys flagrans]|uniref:Uncharacterized protein n=1 Tax=Arthrobotrys flagrans TaxID=97331 RepID=A0A436ZPV6_ARTFL|nr:hypothetical protein DFL_008814 [Arthrobotrys flagrans]